MFYDRLLGTVLFIMKKEYLDIIYDLRNRVIADIERLSELQKEPKYKCCDNMPNEDERMAELRTRRSELSSIDGLIEDYIRVHS
jgi:hypothetical protein